MKKIILLSFMLFAAFMANAQFDQASVAFNKWSNTLDSNRQIASKNNDNNQCIALISRWIIRYDGLPANVQRNFSGWKSGMYYNLACYYARENQKTMALESFKTAVASGYNDYADTMTDSDLLNLHDDSEFKEQLELMREKGDYAYVLKKSGPYNSQDTGLPAFTYQDASDPHLVAFRSKYKLDSVAGNGDEISRFKNLLAWVHNTVRHDGNSNNPAQVNGDSLITVCRAENRGVNCRMMATILRDAYQAEGYKARIVTCMPRDTLDNDCHVIDVVWSNTLNKWVWMDPTFNAYLRDEKGNYLNIEEVRKRFISGAPVIINDDANWNHQLQETKERYFSYMFKNLYWLRCSIESQWDIETARTGKPRITYINLYPGGYTTLHSSKWNNKWAASYATNDPAYFWQKPQ